ncbi:YraN family protein [Herbivorax sp. ANBcel31]|uniref:YraN family protein n=1 Tax=Herbivorax sp. ANBcel31 TaxID=3069754 RepID=UPI0027B16041|nr:YraN family protein [Herbivorax sp. ANBcel31]MDQ2087202.1 YraN family protein [Herbivorax sp. ANBcel31]
MNNKRLVGSIGEEMAIDYLKKNNYKILEKNFRYKRLGEIDIISWESDNICFIEVKTRSTLKYGLPRESVNFKKRENIRKLAQIYINRHNMHDKIIRFDVVEVYIEKHQDKIELKEVKLIKNAF